MASVEKDYLKPTARGVCVTCKQNVTGDLLLCRDRVFHPEHFQARALWEVEGAAVSFGGL